MRGTIACLVGAVLAVGMWGTAKGAVVADSVADFSDTQGLNGWWYGYYDGNLTAATFKLLPSYQVYWEEPMWYFQHPQEVADSYWTNLTPEGGHPNGIYGRGTLPVEQWAVRRWISDVSGSITISGTICAVSLRGMTTGVRVDGNEVFSTVPPQPPEMSYSFTTTVSAGSTVDFIIAPTDHDDWYGKTKFTAAIDAVPEPATLFVLASGGLLLARRRRA